LAAEKKLNDAALAAADKQLAVEMGMAQQTYDDIMANKPPPPPSAAVAAAAAAAKK
jgi:transcriptional regulator with XRE-family HTH domain